MKRKEAFEFITELKLDDPGSKTFNAGIIVWLGMNNTFEREQLIQTSGFSEKEVDDVIANLVENGILIDGKVHGEFDEETAWMELILVCMCASGELKRTEQKQFNIKTKTMSKNLNDILFAQLERLAEASDQETVDLEVTKATSIIHVASQMIDVARMKLQVIQAGVEVGNQFVEIGNESIPASTTKQLPKD